MFSRSHSLFTVTVHVKEICPEDGEIFLKIGKLNLVDLAGSENIGRSGAIDKRAREAGSVNQSLLTLGRVISALADRAPHIPYRESKLTRLLQDSLGGRTKTSIIATISPGISALDETVSTLDYAYRAKNIQNRPEINRRLNQTEMVRGYNDELERLRRDLEAARSKTGVFIDADNFRVLNLELAQQRNRIDDLEERRSELEEYLKTMTDDFKLSQSDLQEINESKKKIEDSLNDCLQNLDTTTHLLQQTQRRLEEERYLFSKHQSTEETLRTQAGEILEAVSTFKSDISLLHNKISRVDLLHSENVSACENISSVWLPTKLNEPINTLGTIKTEMRSHLNDIQDKLVNMKSTLNQSHQTSQYRLHLLSVSACATIVKHMIETLAETRLFAQQCNQSVDEFKLNTITPDLLVLIEKATELQDKSLKSAALLQLEEKKQENMFNIINDLIFRIERSAILWEDVVAKEAEQNSQLVKLLNTKLAHEKEINRELMETFTEAISRLEKQNEIHKATLINVGEYINSKRLRLSAAINLQDSNLKDLLRKLSLHMDSIVTLRNTSDTNVLALLKEASNGCSTLDDLTLSFRRDADNFSTDFTTATEGLHGAAFVVNFNRLCNNYQMAITESSLDLKQLVSPDSLTTQILDFEEQITNKDTDFETCINELFSEISQINCNVDSLDNVSSNLKDISSNLSSQINEKIRAYTPTGETPLRKQDSHPLPTNLAKTASRPHILAQLRTEKGYSPASFQPHLIGSHLTDLTNLNTASDACQDPMLMQNSAPLLTTGTENEVCTPQDDGSSRVGTILPKSAITSTGTLSRQVTRLNLSTSQRDPLP